MAREQKTHLRQEAKIQKVVIIIESIILKLMGKSGHLLICIKSPD